MPAHEQTRTDVVLNRPPEGGGIEAAQRLPPRAPRRPLLRAPKRGAAPPDPR